MGTRCWVRLRLVQGFPADRPLPSFTNLNAATLTMSTAVEVDLDSQVRGVEASTQMKPCSVDQKTTADCLEVLLAEAVKILKLAENEVKVRQQKVLELQKRIEQAKREEKERKRAQWKNMEAEQPLSEEEKKRKAAIRRKWRVLGMKVRVGITANIVRRRKINDANSFIERESEKVAKEDSLDLEGKCEQKKAVKSKWRKGGTLIGSTQGRDSAF